MGYVYEYLDKKIHWRESRINDSEFTPFDKSFGQAFLKKQFGKSWEYGIFTGVGWVALYRRKAGKRLVCKSCGEVTYVEVK